MSDGKPPDSGNDVPPGTAELRLMALRGLLTDDTPLDIDDTTVAVMDMGVEGGCLSLLCTSDGEASIYMSHGGGDIGLGAIPEINKMAKIFVRYLSSLKVHIPETTNIDYPDFKVARFYLRERGTLRGISVTDDFINRPNDPFGQIFALGNHILATYWKMREGWKEGKGGTGFPAPPLAV